MLSSDDLNRQPQITAGMLGLAILIGIFFAGALADRSILDSVTSLWDRVAGWVLRVSTLDVTVPSCPDPGGSWWYQGTLLCTVK